MTEETIESKQLFLREEIIKKGFDAQEFSVFLQEEKGEEKIDLEYWPMEDLKKAVESFKETKLIKNIKKSPNRHPKRRHSSASHSKNRKRNNTDTGDSFGKTISFKEDLKNPINQIDNPKNFLDDFVNINYKKDEEEKDETKIKCIKLEENEITNRDDLYIVIKLTEESNKNEISILSKVEMETKPIGYKCLRKISDFEYLYQKLPLINSEIFNPVLYLHKSENTDIISKNSVIYLNSYINALLQNPYFRTLPIVYNFLKKSLEEWENLKIEKYDHMKEENTRNNIPNLEGYFNLEMEAGDDEKCLQIKNELILKKESFIKLNKTINELLKNFEKTITLLNSLSTYFGELKNKYMSSPDTANYFAHLEIIVNIWGSGCDVQKTFFKDEFRYFFKYMNKENNSFLKYYENFKIIYDEFKSKFDKMSKILYPSENDKMILKNLQREFSFKLVNVYGEYKKLNQYQAKRIEIKLNKVSDFRKILFKHIENINGLLNFFSVKKKDKDTNNEKENEKNKIDNKNDYKNKEIEINDKNNNNQSSNIINK